ncbi:hypothetical protein CCR91_10690 [Thiorhodovibrio winogradskyi]|nr:hypothetical protein [Thiorhodovibrio winogradskyi]
MVLCRQARSRPSVRWRRGLASQVVSSAKESSRSARRWGVRSDGLPPLPAPPPPPGPPPGPPLLPPPHPP